jgi:hypothetical protein
MNKKEIIEHNEETFTITDIFESNGMVAVRVLFPNCPYGDKIMVFKDVTEKQIRDMVKINPHFEKEGITPIARFNPNFYGWDMAKRMVMQRFQYPEPEYNPDHKTGTCLKCGEEMEFNVPRLGHDGGYVHKDTGSFICNDAKRLEKYWCMCTELKQVYRDCYSTCSICGGKDAYGLSNQRPLDKSKTVFKKV